MPKKLKKTREEKIAEDYFPVNETDLKYTIEKQEKEASVKQEPVRTSVEKQYRKQGRKCSEIIEKKQKRKYKRKKTIKRIKYTPPKINLKKEGYELIITEKPQAALKIASSLGNSKQKSFNKTPYYEVDRQGKKIIVSCAIGHLFTLKQNVPNSDIPVFDIAWVPNYLAKKKDFTKRYYDNLLKLAKGAANLTIATDYDIEGELIGLNIVRFICGQKNANRMKFSTLTTKELNKAYITKSPSINFGQAIAGETRHYLDWFYGINLSRALMNSIKATGNFKIMSIGRVQGPALNLIVQKEKKIQAFKPKSFWQVFIIVENNGSKLELKYNKNVFDKKELEKFGGLIGKTAQAQTTKTEQILPPNPPFNLTTLQTEAYKIHGITPLRTLQIAQSLYLAGLISYPRTSSQKLPDSIDYKKILKKLVKKYNVEKLITKQKPIEGKKSDPAHPSIYPTGETQMLSGDQEKIYDLIVKRFLSLFCDNAIIDNKTISATIDNLKFSVKGSLIRKKAWTEIYPTKLKKIEISDLNKKVKITNFRTEQKETKPPKRYSPASIIFELEKRNLGTKATRATILETLYDRNYIKEKSIEATPLGMSLIATLEKYSPMIIDEKLTRCFENEMESIQKLGEDFVKKQNSFNFNSYLKKLTTKEQQILNEAKSIIIKISKDFKKNEILIGQELLQANLKLREQQRIENKLCTCPVCKKGNLAITYSKKTKRHFVACDAYPNCKTTYSLPPNGVIKKANKLCEACSFPMLMLLKKGKRPWVFCFNPNCKTNKKRLEKYNEEKLGKAQ